MLDALKASDASRSARRSDSMTARRPRRDPRSAAAWSRSSAGPTSASRRCSTRWSARRSASPRARRRPRATASPASARVGEAQFIFVDTPGFQTRHGAALNRTLNRTVHGRARRRRRGAVRRRGRPLRAWTTPRCWRCCRARQAGAPGRQQARRGAPPRRPRALAAGACRSATRSPSSCRCRPRTRRDVERLLGISSRTCPSSPGSTTKTSSPTAASASSPARSSARSCSA